VEKYNVDRDKLISNLDNTVYDDISAIYYLMYYDKYSKENNTQSRRGSNADNAPWNTASSSSSSAAAPPRRSSCSSSSKRSNAIPEDAQPPKTPTVLKPIEPVRARRYTMDSSYRPVPINPSLLVNRPKIVCDPNDPIDNILNGKTNIKENSGESNNKTTTSSGEDNNNNNSSSTTTKKTTTEVPSKILVPVPPTSAKTSTVRRLRHNTISEAVPPLSIKQFNDNKFNNSVHKESENENNPDYDYENENNETNEQPYDTEENNDPTKPRSLRFNMNTNTTSSKAPDEIVRSVIMACKTLNIAHKLRGRFLIECSVNEIENVQLIENLSFEVEVCKLPRLDNMVNTIFFFSISYLILFELYNID